MPITQLAHKHAPPCSVPRDTPGCLSILSGSSSCHTCAGGVHHSLEVYCDTQNPERSYLHNWVGMSHAGGPPVPEVYTDTTDPEILTYQQHQQTAARPSPAEEVKKLVHLNEYA